MDRPSFLELAVHPQVVSALLGSQSHANETPIVAQQDCVRLLHRLGYDVVKVSAGIPWEVLRLSGMDDSEYSHGSRSWQDQHHGPIADLGDVKTYPWPDLDSIDFSLVDAAIKVLPQGMALVGFSGGVLEFSMDLIGMERFMFALVDQPELIEEVVNRVGQLIYDVFERYCSCPEICALWLGDDLGHRSGPLVSPQLIRALLLPWYKRFASLAHSYARPMLLHSCGNVSSVMRDLVQAGIDAKHSFEDAIEPVEQFMDGWGDRIGVLGGVDVHLLSVGPEDAIKSRVRAINAHAVRNRFPWVCGSGNSIPNYVAPEHYLAMIEAGWGMRA